MSKYIFQFTETSRDEIASVGGKGANLGEMTRAGLPVPPGFCISADAYRVFTQNAQAAVTQILNEMRMDDADDVEVKSARLREFLTARPMPEEIARQIVAAYAELQNEIYGAGDPLPSVVRHSSSLPVAVRSSATAEDLPDASFAGQQDTYLNVRGDEQLLDHVKKCWASLWTARAVTYRVKQGYAHDQVALAVVVQAMIESEVAGILFTANPINNARDEMVLNASWGLGEAIVSGMVTPDTWIVKKDGGIVEREIASKEIAIEYASGGGTREVQVPQEKQNIASMSDEQVRALTAVGDRVEQHYARPMDIEWAFALGNFYMLQARPITTLQATDDGGISSRGARNPSNLGDDVPGRQATDQDLSFAIGGLSSARGEYNRTMFVEIFPDPLSPAFLSVIAPLFQSMLDFTFVKWGFEPPQGLDAVGVFYNQPYFHRDYIQAALAPLSPQVRNALVMQIVNPFGRHERKLVTEVSPAFLGMIARMLRFMTAFPKQLPHVLAEYRAEIKKFDSYKFEEMSDEEIVRRVRELVFTHASHLLNYNFLMIALIGLSYQMLGTLLERYHGGDTEQVRAKLISGVTGNITMQTNIKLWKLAQEAKRSASVRAILQNTPDDQVRDELQRDPEGRIFLAQLDAFLEQYGHREIRMDILYPTWGEDPAPVLQFIRGYFDADERSSPLNQQDRLVRERRQLEREVDEKVTREVRGRVITAPLFHWVLDNTQKHTRERDTVHFELTRMFPPFRRALLELGTRWQRENLLERADDIFFLTVDEMEEIARDPRPDARGTRTQMLVQERRAEFEQNARRTPPPLIRDGIAMHAAHVQEQTEPGALRGVAGSPGRVAGIVRVIRGPHEFYKLKRGEILVAPLTNPVWTPLFAIAGGIITQVGGILSHGAIVAREYGIPAVMAVHDATNILQDGQRVTVDGNRGIVRVE